MAKPDHTALILNLHVTQGLSLRAIERQYSLANGALSVFAKRHSIPVRSKGDQIRVDFTTGAHVAPSGVDHWAYGQTKETSAIQRGHSERMTSNNPSQDPEVMKRIMETKRKTGFNDRTALRMKGNVMSDRSRKKLAKSMVPVLIEHISEREKLMQIALAFDNRWIFQYSTEYHVLDFAWPEMKVAFEVDTGGHKLERATKRDGILVDSGWTILRIRYDLATGPCYFNRLFKIAEHCVPDFHCPDKYPSTVRNVYRVVIRCPENRAGLHVDNADDPAFIDLAARIRNRLKSALVRQD